MSNNEDQPMPKVQHDNEGMVYLSFHTESQYHRMPLKKAAKLGTELKKHAINAEFSVDSLSGWIRLTLLFVGVALLLVIAPYMIYYLSAIAPEAEWALPTGTAIAITFILAAALAVLLENHLPVPSKFIIAGALIATAADQAHDQAQHQNEQMELAAKLEWLDKCDSADFAWARENNEVPDCTPAIIKNNPMKPVK